MSSFEPYDLLANALLALNKQGVVVDANLAAQELFGRSQRRLVDNNAMGLFDFDASLRDRFLSAAQGRFGVLRLTATAYGPAGTFLAGLTVMPLDHPQWSAFLEVRNLNQEGVADRAQQLSRELEVQRESLRNLAHEIKNPLGGIRGAAQLLQAELNDRALNEYTSVIVAEVDRLRALIDRLIVPQSTDLVLRRFNIHEVCERVVTLIKAEFAMNITVLRDYDASVPELTGDPQRLLQALLNVARNGAQALSEDSSVTKPTLTLRTRIGRQLATSEPIRTGVVISVIDNGPGVPKWLHDKVFHPLVTGRAQGTGLGLSLAQEFVQQHGGLVEMDSTSGHTEFRLILPLSV